MIRARTGLTVALLCFGLQPAGCDSSGDKGEGKAQDPAKTDAQDPPAKSPADAPSDARRTDDDEDKGNVSLMLGDETTPWVAKRARAKIKDGKLRISAGVSHETDGGIARRQLRVSISNYDGVGTYKLGMNSSLAGVSIKTDALKKAADSKDDKATEEATKKAFADAVGGGSVSLLEGATVEVTKVTDDFVDGTLTWSGVALKGPSKIKGEFHARIKKG